MEEKLTVPYIVYEGAQARQERQTKRLIAVIIVLIALLFASHAAWLWAWMSFDYVEEYQAIDVNSDGGGNANYIGRDLHGGLTNGENTSGDPAFYAD